MSGRQVAPATNALAMLLALAAQAAVAGPGPAALRSAAAADGPPISWTWAPIVAKPAAPRGWVQFQRACAVCHGSGPARPGTRALRAKYHGKLPALLARRTDLSAQYIKSVVRRGVNVMPPFRKTELSDRDLDAIAAYLTRRHRS